MTCARHLRDELSSDAVMSLPSDAVMTVPNHLLNAFRLAEAGLPVPLLPAGPLPPPFIPFDASDPQRRRPPKQGPGVLTMPTGAGDVPTADQGPSAASAASHTAGDAVAVPPSPAQPAGTDIHDQLRQQAGMTSPPIGSGGVVGPTGTPQTSHKQAKKVRCCGPNGPLWWD